MKKLLILLIFLFPGIVFAEDLYVSATGGGDNSGSSYANAFAGWAGISWGTDAGEVGPSDTLYICDDITLSSNGAVGQAGTSGNPVTIDFNCTDHPGNINGNSRTEDVGLYIFDANYVTVVGKGDTGDPDIYGFNEAGIIVSSTSQDATEDKYISISNVVIDDIYETVYSKESRGIYALGSNVSVSNCTITDTGSDSLYFNGDDLTVSGNTLSTPGTNSTNADGIQLSTHASGTISNNTIIHRAADTKYGIICSGLDGNTDSTILTITGNTIYGYVGGTGNVGMFIDYPGTKSYIIVEKNFIDGGYQGIYVNDGAATIRYNIITNPAQYALVLNTVTYDADVYNNTIAAITSGTRGIHGEGTISGTVNVKNNIVYGFSSRDINDNSGNIVQDYNLRNGNGENCYGDCEANDQTDPPVFVNPSNDDFRIMTGSAAINNGTDVSLTTDYANNSIVGNPDIGAYEYRVTFSGVGFN